jgi:hypothetical protein
MPDEVVNVTEQAIQPDSAKPDIKPDIKLEAKPEIMPEIDINAINAMKNDFEAIKNKIPVLESNTEKLSKIQEIFIGEDKQSQNEKIFKELAEDPMGTIEKYSQNKTSEELKELKKEIYQNKLKESDRNILINIKSSDPEFETVFSNMGKYINGEDFKKYENDPNRSEIWYGLAKTRMAKEIIDKKNAQASANIEAKNISNQTTITEVPSGSSGNNNSEPDLDRKIMEARQQGNWNKGEDFSSLDADIFARFHRDAYGIKPRE